MAQCAAIFVVPMIALAAASAALSMDSTTGSMYCSAVAHSRQRPDRHQRHQSPAKGS